MSLLAVIASNAGNSLYRGILVLLPSDIIRKVLTAIKKIAKELVRRGVLRALGAYAVLIWLLAQGLVDLFPAIGFPDWSIRVFLGTAAGATPLVAFLAWKYDLTSRGLLPDRRDVAVAEKSLMEKIIGPTQRSSMTGDRQRSMLHVAWKDEAGLSHEREFMQAFKVGRDFSADVRLADDCVSRQHLKVYPEGSEWYIQDLDSLNGTFSNGETIKNLSVGDSLEVRLDKAGPKLVFTKRTNDDTAFTAKTGCPTK